MSQCATCKAEIVWAVTPTGKAMPVDPDPVDNGNLVLDVDARPVSVRPPELTDDPEGPRHVSHFATCPDAQHWRH